ncbi:MAG: hypothetical protein JSR26_12470 [Proteobacteria bacterium]|nr:hypothetical protein [Pseudomonadota bacterium]
MSDLLDDRFSFIDGIAVVRLSGTVNGQQIIRWIGESLAWARLRRHGRVMVVITSATGFAIPSLALRVEMIRAWAAAVGNEVDVAIVCRPEFIDPQKFGITVAAGFGMTAGVFDEEAAALAWLRGLEPMP